MSDDDNKNININSYNQSGGITAYNVNIGPQDRKLTESTGQQLIDELKKRPDKEITVTAVMGDGEAFRFASQVKNFLTEKGYDPKGVNQAVYTNPVEGQIINEKDDKIDIIIGNKQ
jgi:excinuclease UvrABC ATPase subunit